MLVAPSPTPALSLGEREDRSQRVRKSNGCGFPERGNKSPSPQGRGRSNRGKQQSTKIEMVPRQGTPLLLSAKPLEYGVPASAGRALNVLWLTKLNVLSQVVSAAGFKPDSIPRGSQRQSIKQCGILGFRARSPAFMVRRK